jgi:hypothetical protein
MLLGSDGVDIRLTLDRNQPRALLNTVRQRNRNQTNNYQRLQMVSAPCSYFSR